VEKELEMLNKGVVKQIEYSLCKVYSRVLQGEHEQYE